MMVTFLLKSRKSDLYVVSLLEHFCLSLRQQVNIERDFNLKELKKTAEEREKLKEKNAKKEKNKTE